VRKKICKSEEFPLAKNRDWAFNNGAKLYAPSIVVSLGRATDINEFDNLYLKDIKEYQKLQDSINKIHKKYPNFILERAEPKTNCGALTTQSSITVNGNLKLCNMDSGKYFDLKLGNVLQESIKTIYDKNRDFLTALSILQAPNKDSEDCFNCKEKLFCSYCILRGFIGSKRVGGECKWYKKINPIIKEHII
jgi:radical SAM protein with 4Fe4S-binding SPASM domain